MFLDSKEFLIAAKIVLLLLVLLVHKRSRRGQRGNVPPPLQKCKEQRETDRETMNQCYDLLPTELKYLLTISATFLEFIPRDAMHSAVLVIVIRPSLCQSQWFDLR